MERPDSLQTPSSLLTVIAGLVGCLALAGGAEAQVSCANKANQFLTLAVGEFPSLEVSGARANGRGFASFIMDVSFQVEAKTLGTPAGADRSAFYAVPNGNAFLGDFHEVFPDRSNGDEDRWSFFFGRDGALWLRSVTYGGAWARMSNVACYNGTASNKLVITGQFPDTGFGFDAWSFVVALHPGP